MKISQSILSALAEPVLVLDGSLKAVMANRSFCQTLKIDPEDLKDKSVHDLVNFEDVHPRLRPVLKAIIAHNFEAEGVEIECTLPPEERLVLQLSVRRVHAEEGPVDLVLVELRDITREKESERKIMELNAALQLHGSQLQGINEELESFTHSASHDLRTPLRLTNKIAYLLLQNYSALLPRGATDKIHMILDSTREMGKLIEDLLAFSQVKHEPMKKRSVDMRRLAREAIRELRSEQQGRNLDIEIGELPPCDADRALLKQVFLNLLANALKFTRRCELAEIRVGFEHNGHGSAYFVQDNGVGFGDEYAESIFLPFHRLNKRQDFEGSGIGLALVKRIVEHHSGRIWARSEPGVGTTIFFTLCQQQAGGAPPIERTPHHDGPHEKQNTGGR
jgi:PAS domain S-box-containing protein